MYRALEAHMILYLTLYKNYVQNLLESNITLEKDLRETIAAAITNLQNDGIQEKDKLRRNNRDVLEVLKTTDFHGIQNEFDDRIKFPAQFYRNYMSMFETLLLYIRASRQQCWKLRLKALNAMVPYFFSFKMLNYARLTPAYLSQMIELKERDRET